MYIYYMYIWGRLGVGWGEANTLASQIKSDMLIINL